MAKLFCRVFGHNFKPYMFLHLIGYQCDRCGFKYIINKGGKK